MNERRIREVLDVENQAQELVAQATREAERLPTEAEKEARELLERARLSARKEADRIIKQAEEEDDASSIISSAKQRMGETERRAQLNLQKAVDYVVERVIGHG